ncbi:hypothetical protein OIDMADRAFT_32661 [Oidiodendron maius Zn]|uniref:Uncharacterized protein n=1 Tax=Oidiodendron maius (strain Zn) TaxID=913774 RepID=A0A0C3H2J4_OIDMZ|nr:hypothetical protein OIDMADRAFT_32661 [Oidiodendron maius Zn]
MKFSLEATFAISTFTHLASCVALPSPSTIFDSALPANILCDTPAPNLPGNHLHRLNDKSANDKKHTEKRDLEKRDFLYVNVCMDEDYLGFCQELGTNTGNCYNLYNGWDDSISSIKLDYSYTCVFYKTLTIYGPYDVAFTGAYGFNDNISSYFCY